MTEVDGSRKEVAERFKKNLHLPQRLEREIKKAVSASNALAVQEQAWSKRSEKPHGALFEGWVEDLQKAAEYASQLAFEIDCVDIAATLTVKRTERGALRDNVEVQGMVEGKEIIIIQNYDYGGEFASYQGYIGGELVREEDATDMWKKVGPFAVSIENEVERMNRVYDVDDYDDH